MQQLVNGDFLSLVAFQRPVLHNLNDFIKKFEFLVWPHYRLNGSSSHVLTATSLSYGKAKNSTPCRIKTPDLTEIKFDTVDYVGEMTPHAKFHVNLHKGASRQIGEIYANISVAVHIFFFLQLAYRSDPSADFCVQWLKRRVSRKDVPFGN